MPRNKPLMSRSELRDDLKSTRAVAAAWKKAGCPKEGIVVNGVRHVPLPFDELDEPKFEAEKAGK
jgi:hypothetical protein